MASNSSVEILTTIESEPSRRAKLWHKHVAKVCGVLNVAYDADFSSGTIVTGRMGKMRLSLITADGHAVRRTRHDADVGTAMSTSWRRSKAAFKSARTITT